jgi:uncharacterized protein (DUF58 family)
MSILTKKSWILIFLVIAIFFICLNSGVTAVYLLLSVGLGMILFSALALVASLGKVECIRQMKDVAHEDDTIFVKLSVKNESPLPKSFMEVVDFLPFAFPHQRRPSALIVSLPAKKRIDIDYAIQCFKRGLYRVGPCEIVSSDPLGLFFLRKEIETYSSIMVYPKMFQIEYLPVVLKGATPAWFGIDTARISGDDTEFYGIREYRRGDQTSRIHWPSSARVMELVVKEFERTAVYSATLALDLNKDSDIGQGRETTLEYAVKIAASVARYLIRMGAAVQFIAYGRRPIFVPFSKGASQLSRLLEVLATVQAEGEVSFGRLLQERGAALSTRSTLIPIMLDFDRDALGSLIQLKATGINPLVFILVSSSFKEQSQNEQTERIRRRLQERLFALGLRGYVICQGDDLQKVMKL